MPRGMNKTKLDLESGVMGGAAAASAVNLPPTSNGETWGRPQHYKQDASPGIAGSCQNRYKYHDLVKKL